MAPVSASKSNAKILAVGRVGQVHRVVGLVPPDPVGDRHRRQHPVQAEVGVESEEHAFWAWRLDLWVVHRAGSEAAVAVDCAVVEAHPSYVCVCVGD